MVNHQTLCWQQSVHKSFKSMIMYLLDATSFGRLAKLHSKEGLTPSTVGAQAEAHAQENFSYFLPAVPWLLFFAHPFNYK